LFHEFFNVEKAVVAGGFEVLGELRGGEDGGNERFWTDGPDGGDPREFGADMPLVCEVIPYAGADDGFDLFTGLEGKESGIADEDRGVGVFEHRDGIGCGGEKGGASVKEFAEEDFGVGERTAGGGVGGDGSYCLEGVREFDDELDGADFVERGDGAAGDDGEIGGEGSDGDETEVGASDEELIGAERGLSVMQGVALGESGGKGWVFEVPHEGSGVEEVDGGDAEPMGW
jgi:hypothetical protein